MRQASAPTDRRDYWLQEKSVEALKWLTRIASIVRSRRSLTSEDVLYIEDALHGALAYTATIVTASTGRNGPPFGGDVAAEIVRDGQNGMEEFLHNLGIINETSAMTRIREVCELVHPILGFLEGPRGENRTRICSILSPYRGRSTLVDALRNLTEEVTNGVLSWPDYCQQCRRIIKTHQCVKDRNP